MATADVLFSIFDRLKDLIHRNADKKDAEKKAASEALLAAVTIANRTIQYIARRRRGTGIPESAAQWTKRDFAEENALSQGWTGSRRETHDVGTLG